MQQPPTYTLTVNMFEVGVLTGMIEREGERVKQPLARVWQQLMALKKKAEEAGGVMRKLLPNGMLELTDAYGNRIIRHPYSWEIEGNQG